MSNKKNDIVLICSMVILGCFAACNDAGRTGGSAAGQTDTLVQPAQEAGVLLSESQFKAAGIAYGSITAEQLSTVLEVTGTLAVPPQNAVSVTIPFGGTIKSITLLEGRRVARGERLVTLTNPEFTQLQEDYLDNKSQLDYLKTEYERQQRLSMENINAKKTVQKAKADYHSMLGRVNGLRSKLAMLNISTGSLDNGVIQNAVVIYSPISGYVAKVNVNRGSYVGPNDELFRIINADNVYVELAVFEKDIVRIKTGQKVYFRLSGSDDTFQAGVQLIGREIRADRSIPVICHIFEKGKKSFIPGMYVKAKIEMENTKVSALPDKAIVAFQGKRYIFLPEERAGAGSGKSHYFIMTEVQTGHAENGFTAVKLSPDFDTAGRKVVVEGAYVLLSKMMNSEEEE